MSRDGPRWAAVKPHLGCVSAVSRLARLPAPALADALVAAPRRERGHAGLAGGIALPRRQTHVHALGRLSRVHHGGRVVAAAVAARLGDAPEELEPCPHLRLGRDGERWGGAPEEGESCPRLHRLDDGHRRVQHRRRAEQHALLLRARDGHVEPLARVGEAELVTLVEVEAYQGTEKRNQRRTVLCR